MPLQQLFTSRKPYNASAYVAHEGKLFYDEATGYLRLGDGVTPGGKIVGNLAIAATGMSAPINPYEGELWYNPTTKELWAYHNGSFRGTINPATPTELGGIKAGSGVVVASDGTLSLDSTGIPFNFGDFYAFTNLGPHDGACLSSINVNQDVNLVSNGSGSINIVGTLHVHPTDSTVEGALSVPPVFSIDNTGLTKVHTPTPPLGTAVLSVSSNISETVIPLAAGAMGAVLQLTGANDSSSTVAVDTFSNLAASSSNFTFRRYRGTVTTSTAVQSGDLMAAIGATAFDGVGTASLPGQVTSIRYVAAENQTPTNKGSRIDMYAIPINTSSRLLNLSLNGSYVSVPLDTQSTGTATGALITSGGLGVAKDVWVGGTIHSGGFVGNLTGNADTATKLAATKNINDVAFDGSANINIANTTTLTIGAGLIGSNYNGSTASTIALNTATLMTNAVNATTATNAGFAYSFNTGTLVTNAVNATTSTGAAIAYSLANTSTTYVGRSALADRVTNGIYSTDTGTVTNNMLAGSIANNKLTNSSITLNGTTMSLGGTYATNVATSWTPTIVFGTSGGVTYTTQAGQYIKTGQGVSCFFTIVISGSTGVGTVSIGGLPFVSVTAVSNVGGGALDNYVFATVPSQVTVTVASNTTTCLLHWHGVVAGNTNGSTMADMTAADLGTSATLVGRITYISAN